MCGIVGIITRNKRNLLPEIITSLKNLEYRGYDSTGIAVLADDRIARVRKIGAPSDVYRSQEILAEMGLGDTGFALGIGHNRWATHGIPSEHNAHPHTDCSGDIAVVHNGTILNYESLREELRTSGHTFTSETDTEVIPHLIETYMQEGLSFFDAFVATVSRLEGSFGLAVIHTKEPEHMLIAKQGSPLLFGVTEDTLIVASSSNAILSLTSSFIPLNDGEYADLSLGADSLSYHIGVIKDAGVAIDREMTTITDRNIDDMSKGEYESFMEKEIHEQPSVFRTTILGRYNTQTGDAVLGGLIDYEEILKKTRGILTIACGTAHNAALVGGALIERLAGIPVRNEIASEYRYKYVPMTPEDTVAIAISQSGETADTLESVKEVRRKGFTTFGIVNVVGSAIATSVHAGVYARAGIEVGVASTKAFIAQLAIFYLLAIKLGRERGMTPQDGKALIEELELLPDLMKEVLEKTEPVVRELAYRYAKAGTRAINFLGRGIHVPISTEAALKFKELTYLEAGSYPLGELKHGPIAVIDEQTLSVVIMPHDELFQLNKNSLEQILSKKGKVIVITDAKGRALLNHTLVDIIEIPTLHNPIMYPVLEILPLQLFAYHYTVALGNNVDKPRNLAKSVTVE